MRLVTRRTGLSAHVLRAWERRYGAVVPRRSTGGQRLYSDQDIARLVLLKRVSEAGHSLQAAARLSDAELSQLLPPAETAVGAGPGEQPGFSGEGIAAVRLRALEEVERMDQAGLAETLRQAAVAYGLWHFVAGVAVPLMRAVGDRWHDGTFGIANEHLATAVVRNVFAWVNDGGSRVARDAPAVVLGTLSGERHELGALLAAAVAALEGWRVTYLGPDVPVEDVAAAAAATGAAVVALGATWDADGEGAAPYHRLRERLGPTTTLVVGGAAAPAGGRGPKERRFLTLTELDAFRSLLQRGPGRIA
jgi:DNA-binding transcriptional MerR regulator/methylmalonyl-CoA mutase cobalamin-binding subunit